MLVSELKAPKASAFPAVLQGVSHKMARIGGQSIPRSTILLIGSEALLIGAAVILSSLVLLPSVSSPWIYLRDGGILWRLIVLVLTCELSFYYNDLYHWQMGRSLARTMVHLLQSLGVTLVVLSIFYSFNSRLSPGRGIALLAAPVIAILIFSWRFSLNAVPYRLHAVERVLLVGTGQVGLKLIAELQRRPDFNYQVVGLLTEVEHAPGSSSYTVPVVGRIGDIEKAVSKYQVDRVVVALNEKRGGMPSKELLRLKFDGIQIEDPYALYERVTGRIVLERISPSWFIFSPGFRKSGVMLAQKRITDVAVASIGLALTFPFMLIVSLVILIDDGFPILFRQQRIGLKGKPFEILKFRSMRNAPTGTPPSWTGDKDPRVTRLGKFLRTFRLDELPQFFNVLYGEMSVVGPRPEQPYFCDILEEEIPFFRQRHSVRPGITGWAQIKYGYGSSVQDAWRKLELDLFYIKHLSCFLDLAILFETAKVMVCGRGAK